MTVPGPAVPVTFVSSHAKLGGSERYLETLLEHLGGAWVHEVVCLEDGPLADRLRGLGYPVRVVATGAAGTAVAAAASRLRGVLTGSRPSVVHANGVKAALVCALATPGTGLPVVWLKHDVSRDGWLARAVARRCAAVIGVSSAVTRTFRGGTMDKVRVVHTGIPLPEVDRERGRAALVEALGGPDRGPVVGMVARLDPFKGHLELVETAAALRERHPSLRVAFIGGEDAAHPGWGDRVRYRVGELGLDGAVRLLGHRDDALALMSGFDAGVIASRPDRTGMGVEGFPLVGLELMAVGTPVVGYTGGGLPELVGPCGRLVPSGDRAALGAELDRVLSDAALREELARCGTERVRAEFSVERMAAAIADAYRDAARSGRRTGVRR